MKRLLVGLASILLVSFHCKAQNNRIENPKNYKSGYIITIKKDTVQGFIYDRIDAEMANTILFKKTLEDTIVSKFSTKDLLEFKFDNQRTFNRIQLVKNNKDTTFVFAKKIVEGKIDLWLLRDSKASSEYYLVNNSTNQSAPLFRPKEKSDLKIEKSSYKDQDNRYLGVLSVVKNEPVKENLRKVKTKFSETGIQEGIISYNSRYKKDFPTKVYEEEQVYNYDVTVGYPVFKLEQGNFIRAAFYRNKTKVEKSRRLSRIQGITYNGWFDDKNVARDIENGTSNYRWQVLSIIPIGYKIQGTSKLFQPYAYAGIGVGVLFRTSYKFVDSVNVGSETNIVPFPTINMGAGLRMNLGTKYLLVEITPSINGIYMNLGVSF